MKRAYRAIALFAVVLWCAFAANAQFRLGVTAGVNVNSLHLSGSILNDISSRGNRAGFTGGLTSEFRMPLFGWCVDASLIYTHRVDRLRSDNGGVNTFNTDYLEIPVNIKKKFDFPLVGNFIVPYVYTGPSFAFLMSGKAVSDAWRNRSTDIAWNLGFGVELFSRMQVSARYGWGLNRVAEYSVSANQTINVGRHNCWTITTSYFF
ncbi:MAG: PorT family protein [Clostridium sp.]|nr:PorT family protein [Clostridium sp.]